MKVRSWLSRQSLAVRMQVFSLILVLVSAGIIGINAWLGERAVLTQKMHEEAMQHGQIKLSLLKNSIAQLQRDVLLFAALPPISGILRAHQHGGIDPQDGDPEALWKQRLKHVFAAFAQSRPAIVSFRLIGFEDKGREIVRVDHAHDGIHIVPDTLLQQKEHRDYVHVTNQMKVNEVYISDLNLNREFGRLEKPYTPVIRASTPVFDAAGNRFGMIVLDQSMTSLFDRMDSIEGKPSQGDMDYLINSSGEILDGGSEPARVFSFDFGKHYRVQEFMAEMGSKLDTMPDQARYTFDDGRSVHGFVCHFDPANQARRLILLETHTPTPVVYSNSMLWRNISLFAVIALFGGVLATWISRRMTKPLTQLAASAQAIADKESYDDDIRQLPLEAEGELGELAHAFENMVIRVSERERELTDAAKQLQAYVDERDSNLQAFMDAAFGAALRIDEQGMIVSCNHATERIFGYDKDELIGKNVSLLMPEPNQSAHDGYLQAYRDSGLKHIIGKTREVEGKRKNGHIFPVTLAVNEMRLADGSRNFVGIALDISAQKHAESDVRLFRALIDHFSDATFVVSADDGRVLDINEQAAHQLGYSVEEMLQLHVADFSVMPPDWTWEQHVEAIRQHGSMIFEAYHKAKDGSIYPVEISVTYTPFEGRSYILAISRDIRHRREVEAQINKLSRAVEQNPCSILITDKHGHIEYTNRAFTQITGYTVDEAMGKNPNMLQSGLTPKASYHQLWETITSGQTWHGEIQNKRKNGELYWDRSSIAPIMDEAGEITHFVGVQEDISVRKQMEIDLRKARDAAQMAVHAKTAFLTTMSHEIRTPLNTVLGMGELLMESPLNDQQREYVESLDRTGRHLFLLINDILDFSRLDAGHVSLDCEPFDPVRAGRDALDMQAANAKQKGISLVFHAADDVPSVVEGDVFRLSQILVNLVGNAVKFTDQGSVTLEMMRTPDTECTLTFCVRDTGCGIPAHMQKMVFNQFSQAGRGAERRGGTGLGLAICKELVALMHGKIEVESVQGRGSSFVFNAEFTPSDAQYIASRRHISSKLKPLQLLVCDDNEDNMRLIELFLKDGGHHIYKAINGQEGVALFKQHGMDLVLMDLEMPVMDGLNATRAIRRWETQTGRIPTPILALTAHSVVEVRADAEAAGCDDYLTKPVRKEVLLSALAHHTHTSADASPPIATEQPSAPVFSMADVDEDIREVVPLYLKNQYVRLERMEMALQKSDLETLRVEAHSLKGTAEGYGMKMLGQMAAEIEVAAKANDTDPVPALFSQMKIFMNDVGAIINAEP